jgi:hypothetical protein
LSLIIWSWPVWAAEIQVEHQETQPYVYSEYVPYRNVPEYVKGSCVEFAKWYTYHTGEVWGIAGQIKATSDHPYVGGLVLTTESKLGHVAVITKIENDKLYLIEANYHPNQVSTRVIDISEPFIRGYR